MDTNKRNLSLIIVCLAIGLAIIVLVWQFIVFTSRPTIDDSATSDTEIISLYADPSAPSVATPAAEIISTDTFDHTTITEPNPDAPLVITEERINNELDDLMTAFGLTNNHADYLVTQADIETLAASHQQYAPPVGTTLEAINLFQNGEPKDLSEFTNNGHHLTVVVEDATNAKVDFFGFILHATYDDYYVYLEDLTVPYYYDGETATFVVHGIEADLVAVE